MPPIYQQPPTRPLLVGEQNPYGAEPYFALYPAPEGCSGERLCCDILGMYRKDYLNTFERKNLCDGPWSMAKAYKRAADLRTWPAPIILLGSKVARAFEFNPFVPFSIHDAGKTLILPHPSGRCTLWNIYGNIELARKMVGELLPAVAPMLGKGPGK